jgi:acetyltransferase-like isoleucine patch superfamily enzyme
MITKVFKAVRERFLFAYRHSSSERFIAFLRGMGISIGERCIFYNPRSTWIDITRPYLISIGNDVRLTHGVIILTHGADWHVLREINGKTYGSAGAVAIKDNVFVGMNAIILNGVTINENSIVGAGAVVTRDVPPGTVVGGNPAKVIMDIGDYSTKRDSAQVDEARVLACAIRERYGRLPVPDDFKEFFELFLERDPRKFGRIPVAMQTGRYYEQFMQSKPLFPSFEAFLESCKLPPP